MPHPDSVSASNWSVDNYTAQATSNDTGQAPQVRPGTAPAPSASAPDAVPTEQVPAVTQSTAPPEPHIAPTGPSATADPAPADYRSLRPSHHRRRATAVFVLIAFGLLYYGMRASVLTPNPHPGQSAQTKALTQSAASGAPLTKGQSQFATELAQANAYQSVHGTYDGWPAPPGAQVATIATKLVLSQVIDGVCYYAQMTPGATPRPATDATNAACSPANTALNQQALSIEAQVAARLATQQNSP